MDKVKIRIPKKLQKGIPLEVRSGHTVRLEVTRKPLTTHTGLSLFYAMAESLGIPGILDECVHVKQRERGSATVLPEKAQHQADSPPYRPRCS